MLNAETLELKASFRIILGSSSATAIKSIEFARRGEYVFSFYFVVTDFCKLFFF